MLQLKKREKKEKRVGQDLATEQPPKVNRYNT